MHLKDMDKKPEVAVFCHLFYGHTYSSLVADLKAFYSVCSPRYFFNVSGGANNHSLIGEIRKDFPKAILISTPNIGKDIGGKLALMQVYLTLEMKSDYLLLLHDKVSPQTLNGQKWRNELLQIIKAPYVAGLLELFKKEQAVGIIGATAHISNEYDSKKGAFNSNNDALLKNYINEFALTISEFPFIAGNMFWVRSSVFETFFNKYPPLTIRAFLEKGNVMDTKAGTYTHAMERVFSWIALQQGFIIKGI